MVATVKRSTSLSGAAGLLNKVIVQPGGPIAVYDSKSIKDIAYVSIRLINVSGQNNVQATIWIGPKKTTPAMVDIIEPRLVFQQNDVYISEGLSLSRDECIYVQTSHGPFVCRIEGYEDVVPI